ncbi:TPA: hypothetical protein N3A33_000465 [Salmonella enterica subsp. salamae serovar 28:r:e,n,z15]|nr:hypothetical protein [Salmonella enterica subsp. salamae serovar 28:r:e,n,z15]
MTTITKEWLQQTIAEFENTRDDIPFGLDDDDAKILKVLKQALASLTAEPVAYNQVQRDMMKDIIVRKLGGNLLGDKLMMADIHAVTMALIQAGFRTAPPAPVQVDIEMLASALKNAPLAQSDNQGRPRALVVPEEKPMPNTLSMYVVDAVAAIAEVRGWNACRTAMLQGSQPVSNRDELPAAHYGYFAFNQHHGEEFFKSQKAALEFCKEAIEEYRKENAEEGCDPEEVRRTCWGIIMQHGTDIEIDSEGHIDYTLSPVLTGNSPVIPDGWKLAPEKADEDMIAEGNIMASCMIETVGKIDVSLIYGAMLAAAPEKETGLCTK